MFDVVDEDAYLDAPFRGDEPERARAAPPEDAAANGAMGDLGLDATPEQLPAPDDGAQPRLGHSVPGAGWACCMYKGAAAACGIADHTRAANERELQSRHVSVLLCCSESRFLRQPRGCYTCLQCV